LISKEILYVYITKISTLPAICYYTILWKSKIQKCCCFRQHPQQTVDMFLRTLWGLDLTFNSTVVKQTVSRLLTLADWLIFWSLSDDVSNQQLNIVQLNVVASRWFFHPDYLSAVFVLSTLCFMCCTRIKVPVNH